jgi:hypothetical protein
MNRRAVRLDESMRTAMPDRSTGKAVKELSWPETIT